MSLDESNEQQELVAAFKSANRVLKSHIGKRGSGVDEFDDLADDLQEAQQDMEDLQHAVTSRATANDTELESEMDELFGEGTVVKARSSPGEPPPNIALMLPTPPTSTPTLESKRRQQACLAE